MRARCLPNVDQGEVVADCWETRAARCFDFHAEGPWVAVTGAENSLFSFSEAWRSCCSGGSSSFGPRPNDRRPERLRVRGGLSAPEGAEVASREPSNAGRSSTMRRSTSSGSDRDGESAGGSEEGKGGGEAASKKQKTINEWPVCINKQRLSKITAIATTIATTTVTYY